jgi:hypothetical protein
MRSLLIAGSLAVAFAAVGAAADPEAPAEDVPPAPAVITPPTPAAAAPSEAVKKPDMAPAAEAETKPEAKTEAKAETKTEAKPKEPAQDQRKVGEAYFKQCMEDWDAATHMTKKEWARTCRRVVDARVKFMSEQMGAK